MQGATGQVRQARRRTARCPPKCADEGRQLLEPDAAPGGPARTSARTTRRWSTAASTSDEFETQPATSILDRHQAGRARRRWTSPEGHRGHRGHQGRLRQGRSTRATWSRWAITACTASRGGEDPRRHRGQRLTKAQDPERGRADRAAGRRPPGARQARGPRQAQGHRHHPAADAAAPRSVHHLHRPGNAEAVRAARCSGNFTGIGIQIRKDAATDQLLVVTPIKGSPAYKAGIQAGDLITTDHPRGGQRGQAARPKPEVIPPRAWPLTDAVKKILGKAGHQGQADGRARGRGQAAGVRDHARPGRGRVGPRRTSARPNDDWDLHDRSGEQDRLHPPDAVRPTTATATWTRVMDELTKQGIKGFILDLRFNPGGLLDGAVKISDLFIDDGLIVSIRPRGKAGASSSTASTRAVCWTSRWSAWSTATAPAAARSSRACLQDHNRAFIIGERSYGKGSVQNIQPFERRRDQADDGLVLAAERQEPQQVRARRRQGRGRGASCPTRSSS